MRIAVDVMGGDHAPGELVKGAILAAEQHALEVSLVGHEAVIIQELARYNGSCSNIDIVHTDEYLVETEHPVLAIRQKRRASVVVATKLVKEGKADAVVSAGPSGGLVTAALVILGAVDGIARPLVGGPFLGFAPNTVVMDLGATVDCQPDQLLGFARIGKVYAEKLLGIENPTVALLSNGTETSKGNSAVRDAHTLFKDSGLNFIGNVEGSDIPTGRANVIVCDGFAGNVLEKFSKSLGETIAQWIEERLQNKLPRSDIEKMTRDLMRATNLADEVGGAPVWGVNGVAILSHGRSRAAEIAKAIAQAKWAVEQDLVGYLRRELAAAPERVESIEWSPLCQSQAP